MSKLQPKERESDDFDKRETITLNVKNCARCGGNHETAVFRKLQRSVDMDGVATHWTTCPGNGEPILLETCYSNGEDV
jgi:hypothetical protein